jgi:hypothetical protein
MVSKGSITYTGTAFEEVGAPLFPSIPTQAILLALLLQLASALLPLLSSVDCLHTAGA